MNKPTQTLTHQIKQVPLLDVVQDAGVELRSNGSRHVGLCPFHDEKTPSFFIFSGNRFKCFSCHSHGDAVDFIRELHGCDFNQALAHLGIRRNQNQAEINRAIAESRQRLGEKKLRVQRERDLLHTLSILIRSTYRVTSCWQSIDDLERSGDILQPLCWWTHCHDILARGDQGDKEQIVDALAGMATVRRAYLWSGKFNYKLWLSNFLKEAPHGFKINLHFE